MHSAWFGDGHATIARRMVWRRVVRDRLRIYGRYQAEFATLVDRCGRGRCRRGRDSDHRVWLAALDYEGRDHTGRDIVVGEHAAGKSIHVAGRVRTRCDRIGPCNDGLNADGRDVSDDRIVL